MSSPIGLKRFSHTPSLPINQLLWKEDKSSILLSLRTKSLTNGKRKQDGAVIKLDLEKAFDMVDREFLDSVMYHKGFRTKWRNWIRTCISTTSSSIIINGKPRWKFTATRGLCQGDPLSPFFLIMVTDVLSRLLTLGEKQRTSQGVCIQIWQHQDKSPSIC